MKQSGHAAQQISITQTRRFEIYANIHKALRMFMCDTLCMVGRMDGDDAQEVADGLEQVRELIAICDSHLRHENDFIHTAMETRRPGSSAVIAADHVHHEWELAQLTALANAVEQSSGAARASALDQLYRCLALFVSANLAHMNVEETDHNAVLWETHSDPEIIAIEQAIVASLPPQESASVMRWMIPAMNAAERAEKLSGIRQHAPAPVFDAMLAIAQANLSERDWGKLAEALGIPARLAA